MRKPNEMRVAPCLAHYYETHAKRLPSARQARAAIAHLDRFFYGAMVSDVRPSLVDRYVEHRQRQGVSNDTISRELAVLRAGLRRCVRDELLSAAPKIGDVTRAEPRERVLSRNEAARLLNACRGPRLRHIGLFVLIGLYTGARPSAICQLTWDRVDFEHQLIDLRLPSRIANRKRRAVVPFSGSLAGALRRARLRAGDPRTGPVIHWGGEIASVRTAFRSAARRAGIAGVTPGTLRHTAATWARQGGADLFRIGALLGHTKVATTQRYAKYGADYLRDVLAAIRSAGGRPARA